MIANETEDHPVNRDFVMLFRQSTQALMDLGKLDPPARVLLDYLVMQMDTENSLIVSYSVMAEQLDWSERTVRNKINVLYNRNFIDIYKSGTNNVYTVNAELAWTTYANKRKYAKFSARVLISQSEQSRQKPRNSRTKRITPI